MLHVIIAVLVIAVRHVHIQILGGASSGASAAYLPLGDSWLEVVVVCKCNKHCAAPVLQALFASVCALQG